MEHLLWLLACPADHAELQAVSGALQCGQCRQRYPIDEHGIISFLGEAEQLDGGAAGWDEESDNYADGFSRYTDDVEIPATVGRLRELPFRTVLDHGCGTGRMTAALQRRVGQPVLALDYSRANLRRLLRDMPPGSVLALHADARHLPIRTGSLGGVCSAGVYPLLRPEDRQSVVEELARVLHPDGQLVLSTLNYSWVFRLWRLRGNPGARQGEHLYGRDIYYRRQTAKELRRELSQRFTIQRVRGVRNIPVRTIEAGLERALGARRAAPIVSALNRFGPKVDRALEWTVLSRLTGFMLLAVARPRPGYSKPPAMTSSAMRSAL